MLNQSRYQVGIKVLQAARYGAPQKRERVIIWAAKLGLDMPKFPVPSHAAVQKQVWTIAKKWRIEPVVRFIVSEDDSGNCSAPSRAVTVKDAISDLVSVFFFRNLALSLLTNQPSHHLTGTLLPSSYTLELIKHHNAVGRTLILSYARQPIISMLLRRGGSYSRLSKRMVVDMRQLAT